MRKVIISLFIVLSAITFTVSCTDDEIIADRDSSLIWHEGDEELLDSIVEYQNGRCIYRQILSYDEYGRKSECLTYSLGVVDGRDHYQKSEWIYSNGGKNIEYIIYELEGDKWKYRHKQSITVKADRDSCFDTYNRDAGNWVLTQQTELLYDTKGRLVMECGFVPSSDMGSKREYEYDIYGNCITNKVYILNNGDWMWMSQQDLLFDENGNCILSKHMHFDRNKNQTVGDSIAEHSFDEQNRETGYSLKRWDFDKAVWTGIIKYTLEYDERGNVIENATYSWDEAVQTWVPKEKTTKSYDAEGRLVSDALYSWKDSIWAGIGTKNEKRYDERGSIVYDVYYTWSDSERDWVFGHGTYNQYDPDGKSVHYEEVMNNGITDITWTDSTETRIEYNTYSMGGEPTKTPVIKFYRVFDESGRTVRLVESFWNGGGWIDDRTSIWVYDAYDNTIEYFSYIIENGEQVLVDGYKYESVREGNTETRQKLTWNLSYKKWEPNQYKTIYEYDVLERVVSVTILMKVWDNAYDTHWENEEKTEYSYDSNGNCNGYIKSYWSTEENRWVANDKHEYAFDSNGNKTLEVNYMYDGAQGCWEGSGKWEARYDDKGQQIMLLQYNWISSLSEWSQSLRTEFVYDTDGRLIDKATYRWSNNSDHGEWLGDSRTVYLFDDETKTTREYNLEFDRATNEWQGTRNDRKTDGKGRVIQDTRYSWKDGQGWYVSLDKEWSYDSKGNILTYSVHSMINGVEALSQESYTYDSKNRLVGKVKTLNGAVAYTMSMYYSIHNNIRLIDGIMF